MNMAISRQLLINFEQGSKSGDLLLFYSCLIFLFILKIRTKNFDWKDEPLIVQNTGYSQLSEFEKTRKSFRIRNISCVEKHRNLILALILKRNPNYCAIAFHCLYTWIDNLWIQLLMERDHS